MAGDHKNHYNDNDDTVNDRDEGHENHVEHYSSEKTRVLDVTSLSNPVVTTVSIVLFFIWATNKVLQEKYDFIKEVNDRAISMEDKLSGEYNQLNSLVEMLVQKTNTLTYRQNFVLSNLWSKRDHMLWCGEAEKINKDFKCLDYDALKRSGLLGTYEKHGLNDSSTNNIIKDIEKDADNLLENLLGQVEPIVGTVAEVPKGGK